MLSEFERVDHQLGLQEHGQKPREVQQQERPQERGGGGGGGLAIRPAPQVNPAPEQRWL